MSKYILPDSAFAKGVIPTWEELKQNRHGHIDWLPQHELMNAVHTAKDARLTFTDEVGDPFYYKPDKGNAVKPGMLPAAEATAFLAERTYTSVFHQLCEFKPVTSKRNTIVFYDADGRLQSMTAIEDGLQRKRSDITPDKNKTRTKTLVAEPYIETADFTWTLMHDNLVGQRFLQEYMNAIGRKRNWNMGILELYAKKDTTASDTDGLHANDGVFKQLDDIYTYYKTNVSDKDAVLYGQGYYCGIHNGKKAEKVPLDFTKNDRTEAGNIIEQLVDMETQYFTQQGLMGHQFLVSYEAYGQLKKLASQRETDRGDRLYFGGENLEVNGTPIIPCMELGLPQNGYSQHVLLGNYQSAVMNGMRENFGTDINWDFNDLRWKVNTIVYFGTLIKYDQDILAAEVTGLPTQVAAAGAGDSNPSGP